MRSLLLCLPLTILGCLPSAGSTGGRATDESTTGSSAAADDSSGSSATTQPTSQPSDSVPAAAEASGALQPAATSPIRPPQPWIDERVASAASRLAATPAGQVVWRGIEAHGGLAGFFEHSPWQFRFDYRPSGDRPPIDTVQVIDAWSARAAHHLTSDPQVRFGWDGTAAWVAPADATPVRSPRFWALTPWYFVAIPWVLADPGVLLAPEPAVELGGEMCDVVRATFAPGTGDAPDDYYVVYFSQATGQVRGLRYVVSYPAFFPHGGQSPEKLMLVEELTTTAGLQFAGSLPTFEWSAESGQGVRVTEIRVSDMAADVAVDAAIFAMPADGAPFDDLTGR